MSTVEHLNVRPDPVLDEIRAIRRKLSERFENDVDKLCDHLQKREQEHPERLADPRAVAAGQPRSAPLA